MGTTRQAKLEGKLEVCHSVFHRDVEFGLARLAGPHLHYFPNTAKEEGFLSLVEGYGGKVGVHGEGRLCHGNRGKLSEVGCSIFLVQIS